MSSLGRVGVQVTADTSGVTIAASKASMAFNKMEKAAELTARNTSKLVFFEGLKIGVSVLSTMSGIVERVGRTFIGLGSNAAASIDAMAKLSQQASLTYRETKALGLVASESGASFEQLTVGLATFSKNLGEAMNGSKSAIAAFDGIGISVDKMAGFTQIERFSILVDAIRNISDPAQRSAAAMKIFGESGVKLAPLFNAGSVAIRNAIQEVERMGHGLSQLEAKSVEDMNDTFGRVHETLKGIVVQVVAKLAPSLTDAANRFKAILQGPDGDRIIRLGESFSKIIGTGVDYVVSRMDQASRSMDSWLAKLESGTAKTPQWVSLLINAVRIVDGAALVIRSALQVVESVGGFLIGTIAEFARLPAAFGESLTSLFGLLPNSVSEAFGLAKTQIAGFQQGLSDQINRDWQTIYDGWGDMLGISTTEMAQVAKRLESGGSSVANDLKKVNDQQEANLRLEQKVVRDRIAADTKFANTLKAMSNALDAVDVDTSSGRSAYRAAQRGDEWMKLMAERILEAVKKVGENTEEQAPPLLPAGGMF